MTYECATCGEELDIVGIISHDCDRMLSADNLSRSERNTLMYIESQVVDGKGQLDPEKMNYEDFQNIKVFRAVGILDVEEGEGDVYHGRHGRGHMDLVTKFTDKAWDLNRDCRKMRASEWVDQEKVKLEEV